MRRVFILGAGVMGSSLAATAAHNPDNDVVLGGTFLDDHIVESVKAKHYHPTLDVELPATVTVLANDELDHGNAGNADIVILGVSSPGVAWAMQRLADIGARPGQFALVTKGLVPADDEGAPMTYVHALQGDVLPEEQGVVGIGGPCIARELALQIPTRVVFAAEELSDAAALRDVFTAPFYHIGLSDDVHRVEACAALKNFLCIGVSAMISRYRVGEHSAKNPVAALFNQAVHELAGLSDWIARVYRGERRNIDAFDLAGLGDLHVTVGGGRNSRLGMALGEGNRLSEVLAGSMQGVTVEGVDTGRVLHPAFVAACESGLLRYEDYPVTAAILDTIMDDASFDFDFTRLPLQAPAHLRG